MPRSSFIEKLRTAFRRVLTSEGGGAAAEMALIFPVFLTLLFGVLEIGFVMSTNSVMDGATRDAARQIRTGQAQKSNNPIGTFTKALCGELTGYIACSNLVFDVRSFANFSSVNLPPMYDANGKPTTGFTPGGPGQVVTARVSYRYQFMVPMVGILFSPDGSNSILLTSTVVFLNEPYT